MFHRYLSPRAFASKFAPLPREVNALRLSLEHEGLHVGALSDNGLFLRVSGSTRQIESAFHTHLERYRLPTGRVGWSTTTAPFIRTTSTASIAGVIGLENLSESHAAIEHASRSSSGSLSRAADSTSTSAPHACTQARAAASSANGWTDDQLAQAYGLSSLYQGGDLGQGQTIAVFELEPFSITDVAQFDECYFGADHTSQISVVPLDGFNLTGGGSGEADLDVETISALAPDANIVVYEAPNTSFGSIDAYNAIVSADAANIISTSWGECESALEASVPGAQSIENYLFEEAAIQGQTVIAASGDTGSDDCAGTPFNSSKPVKPYLSVDDPSSQPYVLSVGGTSLGSTSLPAGQNLETSWNDGAFWGGGGGGVSSAWRMPTWQASSVIPGVRQSSMREIPDVSASSDEWHGVTIYQGGGATQPPQPPPIGGDSAGWTTIGGTSSASPMWAAILADIAASGPLVMGCQSLRVTPGGADLGFVVPELYGLSPSQYAASFHDVAVGDNDVFNLQFGYHASAGYDLVTGLGSPVVVGLDGQSGLAQSLCAAASGTPRPAIASISPSTGPASGGGAVAITLSDPIPSGATVSVQFGATATTVISASGTNVVALAPASAVPPGSSPKDAEGAVLVSVTEVVDGVTTTSLGTRNAIYRYVDGGAGSSRPSVAGIGPSGGSARGGNLAVIYGSDFDAGAPVVSFGGVRARQVKVVSDSEIRAVVPAERAQTRCTYPERSVGVCQVEVVVTNAHGSSLPSRIRPPISGRLTWTAQGVIRQKPGSEVSAAASEYDYSPRPRITAIVPPLQSGPAPLRVTIKGSGFSALNFEWVNFGPPTLVTSEQLQVRSVTATSVQIDEPAYVASQSARTRVSVQTLGGLSNQLLQANAPRPSVAHLSSYGGPIAGHERLTLQGWALNTVTDVRFVSELDPSVIDTPDIVDKSADQLTILTPKAAIGPYDVLACNKVSCALAHRSVDTYEFFDPREPSRVVMQAGLDAQGRAELVLFGEALKDATSIVLADRKPVLLRRDDRYPIGDPYIRAVQIPMVAKGRTIPVTLVEQNGRAVAVGDFVFGS
jgi:hypothetical protein